MATRARASVFVEVEWRVGQAIALRESAKRPVIAASTIEVETSCSITTGEGTAVDDCFKKIWQQAVVIVFLPVGRELMLHPPDKQSVRNVAARVGTSFVSLR
jgi:hypothetical protein